MFWSIVKFVNSCDDLDRCEGSKSSSKLSEAVFMSHSLCSGMVPGLVEMVLTIETRRFRAKKEKRPACHFAVSALL